MAGERFHRQELLFGEAGQRQLESQRVGIVGLGGIGSHVAQSLAYLGVRSYTLVDKDIVEPSNLNRLVGATESDALDQVPKIEVTERVIRNISLDATIIPLRSTNRSRQAIDILTQCSFLFGCVDNDGARLVLSELAAAYSIPLIDSATGISPLSQGPLAFGGRVVFAQPGEYCLACAGQIDIEEAKRELESPAAREVRRAHGYGLGEDVPSPAVVSLNGVIANLAVTEFLMAVTGIRPARRFLDYRGERGIVFDLMVERDPDCFTCRYLAGIRERANLYRYVTDEG